MSTKKTALKTLPKKGISPKKAGGVKGGSVKQETLVRGGIYTRNHNLTTR